MRNKAKEKNEIDLDDLMNNINISFKKAMEKWHKLKREIIYRNGRE